MPKPEEAIRQYLAAVDALYRTGKATEHSYRPALRDLLSALLPEVAVINEPKRIECGAPDYILQKGGMPVAFVEAKDIGDADLAGKKGKGGHKEQFDRYKAALDTIAFTDYLEFRLWEAGSETRNARLGEIRDGGVAATPDGFQAFQELVAALGNSAPQKIGSAPQLARLMAGKARLLKEAAERLLETAKADTPLPLLIADFQKTLMPGVTNAEFADIYAQTLTYGLFAARLQDDTPGDFSRYEAAALIPQSNPFLKQLFGNLGGGLEPELAWAVDDLVTLFGAADIRRIMRDYGRESGTSDPMIHFYEDFLAAYDAGLRKDRGVWYTPLPVVRFIVRAVDWLLETRFGLSDGLANSEKVTLRREIEPNVVVVDGQIPKVQILDPATGTGTFLAECITRAHAKFAGNEGRWPSFAAKELVPRLNGFELLMASYTMAHIKLDLVLRATGGAPTGGQRFRVYLTDSLAEPADFGALSLLALGQETAAANRIKKDWPVMVVLGNPPYLGESKNKGKYIMKLVEAYKKEPGGKLPLVEKNPKWLNDDYVKFIRLAEHYIERNGNGIVGFITPHGFLDNPTFRGMRWRLLQTFDEICVLNLHGNYRKKEVSPDGSKDENVFNIQQGVSINIFVKAGRDGECRVRYADLYGKRAAKLEYLETTELEGVAWTEVAPAAPQYFFVPKDTKLATEYMEGFAVNEMFTETTTGIVSANDEQNFSFTEEEQRGKIADLLGLPESEWREKYHRRKDSRDWTYAGAKADALKGGNYCQISYRPFDKRFSYYTGRSRGLYTNPRDKVMRDLMRENFCLVACRMTASEYWGHVIVAENAVDNCLISGGTKERGYAFPLYRYKAAFGEAERVSNLNSEILAKLEKAIGRTPSPEEVFDYIYAVLHAPQYRTRYAEFLKVDFPRVPYPADDAAFRERAAIGKELRETHLMHDAPPPLSEATAAFPVAGDNRVEKAEYAGNAVWINESQRFANVPAAAWKMRIGGYQPAEKWLKDRKGRCLSDADLAHYQRIILALRKTGELVARLAELDP